MITERLPTARRTGSILPTYCAYDKIVGQLSPFLSSSRISTPFSPTGRVEKPHGNLKEDLDGILRQNAVNLVDVFGK